jgi:flavin-dependent dehydrogenase
MTQIRILGAGLSGLTAAINLAKKGYEVDVYEKNEDVGMRFHGDLQGLENWSKKTDILEELKEMNINVSFDCDPFSKVILTNCSKTKEINFKRPLFYLVKRGSFSGTIDHSLKVQALKSGVNIHFQKTLSPNEVNIVATGPIPREVVGVVKGIIFRTNVKDTAIVALNDKLAFKAYSYLLITKRYGCMCTVVLRDEMCRVNAYFENTKEFFVQKLNLDIRSLKDAGGISSFSMKNVKKGTASYGGEAAGLQDFLWGFGMRFAITSGYLAAQSIISNEDYERIAKKHFRNRLKAGVVNRYLWENILCKKDYLIVINIAEFLKKNIYSMHNHNLLQRMIYPLALFSLKRRYPELKL